MFDYIDEEMIGQELQNIVIPDRVEAVVAWRVWEYEADGISGRMKSINGTIWEPHKPLDAADGPYECLRCCNCNRWSGTTYSGIYAMKDQNRLFREFNYADLYGEVYMWGRVFEHTHGYRSEFAYPKSLYERNFAKRAILKYTIAKEYGIQVIS